MLNTIFFNPLYNALMWLVAHVPDGNIILAIIILTIVAKLILAPLTLQSLKSQVIQKMMQPEMARLKKEHKDPKELSLKTMELYKKYNSNPFSGCLVLIIQIPIIFALYYVFMKGLVIKPEILYSFVSAPDHIGTMFLGIDVSQKHIVFAIIAAVTQFVQLWFSPTRTTSVPKQEIATTDTASSSNEAPGFGEQLGNNMQKQMLYMMPLIILFVGMSIPAAITTYLIISNLFTLVQEYLARPALARIGQA